MERSYDDNLTFQPVINKSKPNEKSETRSKIDAACKKVSSSSILKRNNRNSEMGASLKRSHSAVSSVESERGGVIQDKSLKMLGEKLDRELRLASAKVLNIPFEEVTSTATYLKEEVFKVLDGMMYLNTKIGSPVD